MDETSNIGYLKTHDNNNQGITTLSKARDGAGQGNLQDKRIIFLCLDDPIDYGGYVYSRESFYKELCNILEFIYNSKSNSVFTDKLVRSVKEARQSSEWRKECMKITEVFKESNKQAKETAVPVKKIIRHFDFKQFMN